MQQWCGNIGSGCWIVFRLPRTGCTAPGFDPQARRVGTYRFVYVYSRNRCCFNVMYLALVMGTTEGSCMATIPFLVVFASYKDVHRSGLVKNQYHV